MKVGVDSYSYHRLLGGIRPVEEQPRLEFGEGTISVLREARRLDAEFVALETMFMGSVETLDPMAIQEAAGSLELGLSWGGAEGFAFGVDTVAHAEFYKWLEFATRLGCQLVRVVAGGPRLPPPSTRELVRTAGLLSEAADAAADREIQLALENHGDFSTAKMLKLLEDVDHPSLGACLDPANAFRMGDDPLESVRALAPAIRMVHLRDCLSEQTDFVAGPITVRFGEGVIPIAEIVDELLAADFSGPVCVEIGQLAPGADELELTADCVRWLQARRYRASQPPSTGRITP